MNFMEMVMALFAIVFFTTISMVYNRSMWGQAENLDNVAKIIQATQVAHNKLDEIDAKLLSQQFAFAQIQPDNDPPTVAQACVGTQTVNLAYAGYVFNSTYDFDYCDSLGVALADQSYNPTTKWIKMTVTIASTPGMSHQVAVSRIYTKTNLYLDY